MAREQREREERERKEKESLMKRIDVERKQLEFERMSFMTQRQKAEHIERQARYILYLYSQFGIIKIPN